MSKFNKLNILAHLTGMKFLSKLTIPKIPMMNSLLLIGVVFLMSMIPPQASTIPSIDTVEHTIPTVVDVDNITTTAGNNGDAPADTGPSTYSDNSVGTHTVGEKLSTMQLIYLQEIQNQDIDMNFLTGA